MGRQEPGLALAAAAGIRGLADTAVISVGSDRTDGPTDAAGGLVDRNRLGHIRLGLDLEKSLPTMTPIMVLTLADAAVRTGPTGTNVNDLTILLCR